MEKTNKPIPQHFFVEHEMRSADPADVAPIVSDLIAKYKVVKLVPGWHLDDLRSFYQTLTVLVGKPVFIDEDWRNKGARTGAQWLEIRYDANIPDNEVFRYSQNAQPLHTDGSYYSGPMDVMVFYSKNKAEHGGETVFVDGKALVDRMREISPELLSRLLATDVKYEKAGDSRREPIISLGENRPPMFNYNYYCVDKDESDEGKKLNHDFFDFLQTHVKGSYLETAVALKPGEAIFWWDEYVLHGRLPFKATRSDDRLIWKTALCF